MFQILYSRYALEDPLRDCPKLSSHEYCCQTGKCENTLNRKGFIECQLSHHLLLIVTIVLYEDVISAALQMRKPRPGGVEVGERKSHVSDPKPGLLLPFTLLHPALAVIRERMHGHIRVYRSLLWCWYSPTKNATAGAGRGQSEDF